MRTKLIQIGNSRGVRLSKALIEQFQLDEEIMLQPLENGISISSATSPRYDWEEKFKAAAPLTDKKDEWNNLQNKFELEERTW